MDWSALELPHYLCIGGGAILLLAILSYFIAGAKVKIPTIAVATIASLVLGFGSGMIALSYFKKDLWFPGSVADLNTKEPVTRSEGPPGGGAPGGMRPPGGGGFGGGAPGGGGGGRRGGRGGFNPSKMQLTSLVSKLELLTEKPLTLELTDEEKKQVHEQLQGLETEKELSDDEAKKRLDVLTKTLENHKETLTAVGFRWPGEGGRPGGGRPGAEGRPGAGGRPGGGGAAGRPGGAESNPFASEEASKKVKALRDRLTPPKKG